MEQESPRDLLDRRTTPELHAEIRELWKKHSIAEDARDIPGLLSTLTEDCIYELVPTGHVWTGHEGAARFYQDLIGAFPDIRFQLDSIVIGPQGVFEEAWVTGNQERDWPPDRPWPRAAGEASIRFKVAIFFPWDPTRRRFKGERVYLGFSPGQG
jgi:SnoaL-like protein